MGYQIKLDIFLSVTLFLVLGFELVLERRRRRRSDRAFHRTVALQRVASEFLKALTVEEVTDAVIRECLPALGADAVSVRLLRRNDPAWIDLVRSSGFNIEIPLTYNELRVSAHLPPCEVIRSGKSIFLKSLDEVVTRYPITAHLKGSCKIQSSAFLPLSFEESTFGVIGIGFKQSRRFSEIEMSFMEAIVSLCGQALRRAELYGKAKEALQERERAMTEVRIL